MPVLCGAGWRVAIYLMMLLLLFFERGVWGFVSGIGLVVHIGREIYVKGVYSHTHLTDLGSKALTRRCRGDNDESSRPRTEVSLRTPA